MFAALRTERVDRLAVLSVGHPAARGRPNLEQLQKASQFMAPAPRVPPVQSPTLDMWSSGDDYLTEEPILRSADLVTGGWRYVRIEDASHWIPLARPSG